MSCGKRLLTAWAEWRLSPRFSVPTNNPLERIKEDRENAGAGGGEFHYDMIEGVPCIPDGGAGNAYSRFGKMVGHDQKCRDVAALVAVADYPTLELIEVTFSGGHPRDVRKPARICAAALRVEVGEYRRRMGEVYGWVERSMGMRRAA